MHDAARAGDETRGHGRTRRPAKRKARRDRPLRAFRQRTRQRPTVPQPHDCSIIGPGGLNFRVRDGNGCGPSGMVTGNVVARDAPVDGRERQPPPTPAPPRAVRGATDEVMSIRSKMILSLTAD